MGGSPVTVVRRPTIAELLADAAAGLRASPSARLDAELLLAHVLGCSRAAILRDVRETISASAHEGFLQLVELRARGVPVAHLLGYREFWSLGLRVSADTLIPRPETELLVELALARIAVDSEAHIAELGTGCGAIALALAHERSRLQCTATELSAAALAVARENAARMGVTNVRFCAGDWWQPLEGERYDLVISNPPYLGARDPHLQEGDLRFEPALALVSGPSGLEALRIITADAPSHLNIGGWLILEHGCTQAEAVRAMLVARGFQEVCSHRDLAGHERATTGQWHGGTR